MSAQICIVVPNEMGDKVARLSEIFPGGKGMFQTRLRKIEEGLKDLNAPATHRVSAGPSDDSYVYAIFNPGKLNLAAIKAQLPPEKLTTEVLAVTNASLTAALAQCFISNGFYTYTDEQGNQITIEESPLAFIDRIGFEIVQETI